MPSLVLYFFHVYSSFCLVSFYINQKDFFSRARLLERNFLRFCLHVKFGISPSWLNDGFAGYGVWLDSSPLSISNTTSHWLQDPWFLMRSQLPILLGIFCVWWLTSPLMFSNFFWVLAFVHLIVMFLVMDIWIYPTWSLLNCMGA